MKRSSLQPAYVLHRRPYRDNSFLVEMFTQEQGRLTVLAKGVRKLRNTFGLLQPFIPLLISYSGRNELVTLTQVEFFGKIRNLKGNSLFAGFYLNELLINLLQKWDAHSKLFHLYEETLDRIEYSLEEKALRLFEKHLLTELGYGLLIKSDVLAYEKVIIDRYYRFVPEQGLILSEASEPNALLFSGKSLQALMNEDWQDEESLKDAKRLLRLAIQFLLEGRPIFSRKLFG